MSTQDLQSKAQALHELKAFADELAGEIAAIESEIKAEMNVRQVDEMMAGTFKIRWKLVESSRFDSKGFRAAITYFV